MGGKRKYVSNEPEYTEEIGVIPTQYIQSQRNDKLFYNEFHDAFLPLNMADIFTLKKAREIKAKLSVRNVDTYLTTLEKLEKWKSTII